eukprot:m.182961 g.182961  ORF g.182961 m.182961 type:complete len:197 (-) comp15537_c1_seq5:1125-1715(-)
MAYRGRPWALGRAAKSLVRKPKTPEAPRTWSIIKGDEVCVTHGPDEGKIGNVLLVQRDSGNIIVEGVGMKKRFSKESGYFNFETPLHVSRVALIDPTDRLPTKIKWKVDEDSGKRIRISRRTGNEIPKPSWQNEKVPDRNAAADSEKDTQTADFTAVTFKPTSLSFEEDILLDNVLKKTKIQKKLEKYLDANSTTA